MKIQVIQGDSGYDYQFTLQKADGSVTDLTGATLTMKGVHNQFSSKTMSKEIGIEDAENGVALYTIGADDFPVDGIYYGEIEAVYGSGKKITFKDLTIEVLPNAGA